MNFLTSSNKNGNFITKENPLYERPKYQTQVISNNKTFEQRVLQDKNVNI